MMHVAKRENINIRWWNFAPPILGLYWAPHNRQPVIGLDNSLRNQQRLLRCVMAEELGHHFTSSAECKENACFNYENRLDVSMIEFKALAWAARYLVPLNQLYKTVRLGITDPPEIANIFDITEEMVYFRLILHDCKWYWLMVGKI
jgi:Zn-dependent peptidase ImmA (M78 family)